MIIIISSIIHIHTHTVSPRTREDCLRASHMFYLTSNFGMDERVLVCSEEATVMLMPARFICSTPAMSAVPVHCCLDSILSVDETGLELAAVTAAAAASCLFLFLTRSRLRHRSDAMARPHALIGRRSWGKYLSKASFLIARIIVMGMSETAFVSKKSAPSFCFTDSRKNRFNEICVSEKRKIIIIIIYFLHLIWKCLKNKDQVHFDKWHLGNSFCLMI